MWSIPLVLRRSYPCSCTITSKDGEGSGKGGGETKDDAIPSANDDRVTRARSTIVHPIVADSGTPSDHITDMNRSGAMDVKFIEELCISMWTEMNEEGECSNFNELADLMARNMDEYAATGSVASGERIPFAAQMCSPGWLPTIKQDKLIKLRELFFGWTRDTIFNMISSKPDALDDLQHVELKKALEPLGFTPVRSRGQLWVLFNLPSLLYSAAASLLSA